MNQGVGKSDQILRPQCTYAGEHFASSLFSEIHFSPIFFRVSEIFYIFAPKEHRGSDFL